MQEVSKTVGPPLGGFRLDLADHVIPPDGAVNIQNFDIDGVMLDRRCGSSLVGSPVADLITGLFQFVDFYGGLHTVITTEHDILHLNLDNEWESILGGLSWISSVDNPPSFALMMNTLLISDGFNDLLAWTGSGNVMVVSDVYKPKVIVPFYERLIALGGLDHGSPVPQRVRWTLTGTYDDFENGDASFVDLIDTPGEILAAGKIGDNLVISKKDSIVVCGYLGQPSVFGFDTRLPNIQVASGKAGIYTSDTYYYVGPHNIYAYIGGRSYEMIGHQVKPLLISSRLQYINRILGVQSEDKLFFIIPYYSDYPDLVLLYSLTNRTWTSYRLPFAITAVGSMQLRNELEIGDLPGDIGDLRGDIGSFREPLSIGRPAFCTIDKTVRLLDKNINSDVGAPIVAEWISGDLLAVSNGLQYCRYRKISIDCRGSGNLVVYFSLDSGASWRPGGRISLDGSFKWRSVGIDGIGNKIRVRFTFDEPFGYCQIRSYEVSYAEGVCR